MSRLQRYLVVGAGASLGALARHLVGIGAIVAWPIGFPVATLAVNIAGSLIIALVAARLSARPSPSHDWEADFLMTGFCGGFTTFSLFSIETLVLIASGQPAFAAIYVAISVPAWIAAAWVGSRMGAH